MAPSPGSFQTTSLTIVVPLAFSVVPPQSSALGLEPGKLTWASPLVTPLLEPLSPAAMQTDMPTVAASWNAWSNCCNAWLVQLDSGPPQLIEITDGLFVVSCTAMVIASRNP